MLGRHKEEEMEDGHHPLQPPGGVGPPPTIDTGSAGPAGLAGAGGKPVGLAAPPGFLHQPGAASAQSSAGQQQQQLSKRRRGLGVVTPNACTECRKKRAKCDGGRPCSRCRSQKDVECVYEIPIRQSKEHLRSEIEHLRRHQRASDQIFAALIRPELWEEVLTRLKGGQSIDGISDWLLAGNILPPPSTGPSSFGRGQGDASGTGASSALPPPLGGGGGGGAGIKLDPVSAGAEQQNSSWGGPFSSQSQTDMSTRSNSHPDVMNWSSDMRMPQQSRVGSWVENIVSSQGTGTVSPTEAGQQYRGLDQVLAPLDSPKIAVSAAAWTNVTGDASLVRHLLALYFCWEYPTFASLSKEHFLKDFFDGRHRYCSPILVNALLALGCRFSSQPNTRANHNDPYTSGDHFFKESQKLFYQEDNHHSLTTIQALGIMSIREASCGRDSESWYYAGQSIRLAIEMGLHRLHDEGDEDEVAVQAATFWGAFALDHAWSLATGSLPQCSCFPHLPPKPAIIDDIEASLWIPYTDDGAPLQRSCEQPSNVRSVYKCFCELSELVHQSLYILHSPGRPLTSRDLLKIYTQYLNWYGCIPEVLRLGHNFTPAVLFAHMYYHFAILLLFRPLIKLRIIGSSISPRDVCSQAADAIQGLLRSYSQLYTLRRTPSFVPYFVLTSSIMHLAIGASASLSALSPSEKHSESRSGSAAPPNGPSGSASGGATAVAGSKDAKPDASDASMQVDGAADIERVTSPGGGPAKPELAEAVKIDPKVTEAISQGIADLTEMAPCHHFAEQALNILRYLAKKWHIDVDITPTNTEGEGLVQPHTGNLNFFAPNVIEEDFVCAFEGWSNRTKTVPPTATTIENPLFWPFPMQGRPMLPRGRELEEAGFELL